MYNLISIFNCRDGWECKLIIDHDNCEELVDNFEDLVVMSLLCDIYELIMR